MKLVLIALALYTLPVSSSVMATTTPTTTDKPMPTTIIDLKSACPAGDSPIRQSAIDNLLALGDEQIRTGFPDAGLLQLDRVLRLTAKANSPAVTRATLSSMMSRPLWNISIAPQRADRLQRLNQLSRLANQVTEAPFQAELLINIARGYESANAMPTALKIIEPVPELLKNIKSIDTSFALLLATAEFYARSQPERSRKLVNQAVEKLRSLEPEIPPDHRKFMLNPYYAFITRIYALLGQPERAETFAKRVIFSSNQMASDETLASDAQINVQLQVSLAIAYANAKQQAKANRIMTRILNRTNDEPILIDALLQYAKAGQWEAARQATALIKDPKTKFRARLDLGVLADQQGRSDRAIELGTLAAQQAREAGSFSIGRDDVIQWLSSWLSSEVSTNAVLPIMENLELYVYDELVDGVLRGAVKQRQESVIKQALVWADQKAQPNSPSEAMLIYADRNQPDAAIRSALRAKNPYGQLAALASYYQRLQQPQNIAKVKQSASGRLAVETFGDVKQITEVSNAMSAIEAASGRLPTAKISIRQSLQNAKKKLSKDVYSVLIRELANQQLFYGQPDLMALVIAEISTDREKVIQELLEMGKTFSGQFNLRYSSIDRILRGLVLMMDSTPDEKVRTLVTIADLQIYKNQMNEAESTIQLAINLVPTIEPSTRNYIIPILVHTMVKTNRPELLSPVITAISDTGMLQYTQQFAGCSL